MENFLLIKGNNPAFSNVQMLFNRYFIESRGISKQFGEYTLFLFKKGSNFPDNFYEINGSFVGSFGTPAYKGLSYSNGLKEILNDELNGTTRSDELYGHYILFIWNKGVLKIFNDGTGLIKAYTDSNGLYLSSSFLILTNILRGLLTLNKKSITENIITGGITGEETHFNEITEFRPASKNNFQGIKIHVPVYKKTEELKSKREAFELQVDVLNRYFSAIQRLADEFSVDTGLTSGYDSRLLLSLIMKNFKNFHVHSHYRNHSSVERNIAEAIANGNNIEFVSPQVKSFESLSDEELLQVMSSSSRFYDGQIRGTCNWNEEYNTLEYRLKTLRDKRLGFHGIGGEQYRNSDRMCLRSWNFDNWVKFRYIRRASGSSFVNEKDEKEFCDYLKVKIISKAGFDENKNHLTLFDLKRIQNEIFISSYRGARTNAENRLAFFLSPFADHHVSEAAYSIIPFLDCTNNFEIELIRHFSPELAEYPSDYGFPFNRKEPFKKYFGPGIIENLLPPKVAWGVRELYKKNKLTDSFKSKIGSSELLKRYIQNVIDLGLPLNINKLLRRPDIAPLVISTGFSLENYNS